MSIGFEINNRLAVITIDRPEAMNALDMAHNAELDRIWACLLYTSDAADE